MFATPKNWAISLSLWHWMRAEMREGGWGRVACKEMKLCMRERTEKGYVVLHKYDKCPIPVPLFNIHWSVGLPDCRCGIWGCPPCRPPTGSPRTPPAYPPVCAPDEQFRSKLRYADQCRASQCSGSGFVRFLGFPDPLVRGTDPDPDSEPDPSISKYSKKIYSFCDFFLTFYLWTVM